MEKDCRDCKQFWEHDSKALGFCVEWCVFMDFAETDDPCCEYEVTD